MNCPQCHVEMKHAAIGDADIDECPDCRGLWLDQGELDAVKDEVLPDYSWLDIAGWEDQFEFEVSMDLNFCPKCKDIALTKVVDPNSKTEVHLCTQCKGRWLTTGQFLNIVNALIEEAEQKSAPEIARISLKQAKEMLTSDDSFVSEWQDLKEILNMLKHRIFIDHPKLKSVLEGFQKSLPQ